jgi:hypothetical protein
VTEDEVQLQPQELGDGQARVHGHAPRRAQAEGNGQARHGEDDGPETGHAAVRLEREIREDRQQGEGDERLAPVPPPHHVLELARPRAHRAQFARRIALRRPGAAATSPGPPQVFERHESPSRYRLS